MLYLQGIDQISHHFWPFVDDASVAAMRRTPSLRSSLAQKDRNRQRGQRAYPWVDQPTTEAILSAGAAWVPDYYDVVDGLLARVLARVDPSQTTVMVMSDHGFQASRAPMPGCSANIGDPRSFWPGVPACAVHRRAPSRGVHRHRTHDLTRLQLPLAEDMPGACAATSCRCRQPFPRWPPIESKRPQRPCPTKHCLTLDECSSSKPLATSMTRVNPSTR